jgi:hypothetical protein
MRRVSGFPSPYIYIYIYIFFFTFIVTKYSIIEITTIRKIGKKKQNFQNFILPLRSVGTYYHERFYVGGKMLIGSLFYFITIIFCKFAFIMLYGFKKFLGR